MRNRCVRSREAFSRAWRLRGQQPRPSCEQIRTRVLEAAARRAGERVTAHEREAWRQRSCGRDDFALRAAGIGDDRRLSHVLVELVEYDEYEIGRAHV